MELKFTKMQAYGNDYVYIDAINQKIDNPNELAKKVSDRHFGIGSDGLVLICSSDRCDFRMRMFNPDGSEGEMCGNALRSLSKFVYYHHMTDKTHLVIETLGGDQVVDLIVENGEVVNISACIGKPVLDPRLIPVNTEDVGFIDQEVTVLDRTFKMSSLSWGNPHTVVFVDDTDSFDVAKYGPQIEHMTSLFPKKTNVSFIQVLSRDRIRMREWERGTGETIGCGTGCCSSAVITNILGMCDRKVTVEQIGGPLLVEMDEEGKVHMTGPSHVVYEGVYYI